MTQRSRDDDEARRTGSEGTATRRQVLRSGGAAMGAFWLGGELVRAPVGDRDAGVAGTGGAGSATVGAGGGSTATEAPGINRGRYAVVQGSDREYSGRAVELVERATVVDMLSPFALGPSTWLWEPDTFTAEDVALFKESGIDVFHIAVGVGGHDEPVQDVTGFLGAWNGFIATHSDHLMRIDSRADLEAVSRSGKVGVLLGIQNSNHLTRELDAVDRFWSLGQRVSQLTYNARNRIGNGSTERVDGGLSDWGVSVIERMNAVGMAVDVSHCGDRTTLDALEVADRPVLVTHSNARALVPGHPRAKTDEMIRKMAATGGVMGITGVRNFVRDREPTTIEHMLDHYEHVIDLVGAEHVGMGSDIDLHGYDDMPEEAYERLRSAYKDSYAFRDKIDIDEFAHPQRAYALAQGLIDRGYPDDEIVGILGGNFARVLAEIWSAHEECEPDEEGEGEQEAVR